MASACCASASLAARELLCCSQSLRRKGNREFRLPQDRIFLSHGNRFLSNGKIAYSLSSMNGKRTSSAWTDGVLLLGKSYFNGRSLRKQHAHLIKAVALVERTCLVPRENGRICDSDLNFNTDSDSQVFQSSEDDSLEMDEKEKLRRMRISKANKGNVPWNKGRKHSAITLQRIRERTRIAMQDPKVKMKLVNLGHSQSEETRSKIGVGVREGWQRRREKLMVQERCFLDWQNMIAEASRTGYAGEDELQWDSYKILDEQLKLEWLESVEERRTMPRVKGSKRAPKSPEQRRRISEAISAKWADPEYRTRVYDALAKYHGTTIGVERKARKKPIGETSSGNKVATKRKPVRLKETKDDQNSIKKASPRKTRNSAPSYKDPMAKAKFEMIKKIRAKRAGMETKKREATERAKLLIAEAEKAAKALEVAALTSPLALASLKETRKLIAEAVRSIESIERGQVRSKDTGDGQVRSQDTGDGQVRSQETGDGQVRSHETGDEASYYSNGAINHIRTNQETPGTDMFLDEGLVNGSHILPSSDTDYKDFDFEKSTLHKVLSNREPFHAPKGTKDPGSLYSSLSSLQPNILRKESITTNIRLKQTKIDGPIKYHNLPPEMEEGRTLQAKSNGHPAVSAMKSKKWVCGRLVEVEAS